MHTPAYPELVHFAPRGERQDFLETLRKLWRHWLSILFCTVAGGALVAAVLMVIPSRYVAESRVLVGVQDPRVLSIEAIVANLSPDAERVQNESFVIQSRDLAKDTIAQLKLDKSPEFNPTLRQPGFWQAYIRPVVSALNPAQFFQSGTAPQPRRNGEADLQTIMVDTLLSKVDVAVLGRSHVLSIKADSEDADTAAGIANTLAQLYLARQRQEKVDTTGQAEKFLTDRIAELRKQVDASDKAVEQYRQKNGLYKGTNNAGVTSQQLTELNTQIILAQTAKAEAESRLNEARQAARSGLVGDTVPEVLRSPAIQNLKQQQVDTERRLAEASSNLGEKHPRVASVRAEVEDIRRKMRAEIERTTTGLRHEASTAGSRFAALRQNFDRLKGQMGDVNDRSIQLEALERDALVNRNLLENMLRRAKETSGQESITKANARQISTAAPPLAPTVPPKPLILVLGTFAAFLLGSMAALLRDNMDETFRSADQIEAATGLPVIGLIPNVRSRRGATNIVMRDPLSPYAEALRRLHIGIEMSRNDRSPKTVMFASAVPAEGKSVMVASLGRMLAGAGRRVLLIDCDWRCPSQHRIFRCYNRNGLASFLNADSVDLETAIHHDSLSGLDVLFAGAVKPESVDLLSSSRMRAVLDTFSREYDVVLLDTPPVHVGAEVLALSRMVEKVVYTVRWGATPRGVTLDALKSLLEARADVAGIALSRINSRRYRRYTHKNLHYEYKRPALATLQ